MFHIFDLQTSRKKVGPEKKMSWVWQFYDTKTSIFLRCTNQNKKHTVASKELQGNNVVGKIDCGSLNGILCQST